MVLGSPHPFHSVDPSVFPAISFRMSGEQYSSMATIDIAARGLRPDRLLLDWGLHGEPPPGELELADDAAVGLRWTAALSRRGEKGAEWAN